MAVASLDYFDAHVRLRDTSPQLIVSVANPDRSLPDSLLGFAFEGGQVTLLWNLELPRLVRWTSEALTSQVVLSSDERFAFLPTQAWLDTPGCQQNPDGEACTAYAVVIVNLTDGLVEREASLPTHCSGVLMTPAASGVTILCREAASYSVGTDGSVKEWSPFKEASLTPVPGLPNSAVVAFQVELAGGVQRALRTDGSIVSDNGDQLNILPDDYQVVEVVPIDGSKVLLLVTPRDPGGPPITHFAVVDLASDSAASLSPAPSGSFDALLVDGQRALIAGDGGAASTTFYKLDLASGEVVDQVVATGLPGAIQGVAR